MPPGETRDDVDDAVLVSRAQQELPYATRAYQQLVERHYPLLLRYCSNILRNPEYAEDACQTVLIKVFHALPRFRQRSSFKTWLLKIAGNTCFTMRQKNQRRIGRTRYLDQEQLEQIALPANGNARALGGDRFARMIAGLSDLEQQLPSLRFVGELSLSEIAEVTGLNLSAAKMRYYRALEKLKANIETE